MNARLLIVSMTASLVLVGCATDLEEPRVSREPVPGAVGGEGKADGLGSGCDLDGVREAGEQCDGQDLGGMTCASFQEGAQGTLRCSTSCTLDARGCFFDAKKEEPASCEDRGDCAMANNIMNATPSWIDASELADGPHAQNAAANGKIYIPSASTRCSATLIDDDLIITNQHCVGSAAEAQGVRFYPTWETGVSDYQRYLDSVICDELVLTDCSYDVTVLRCSPHVASGQLPGTRYGVASIALERPAEGSEIYLLHTNCDYRSSGSCNNQDVKLLSPGVMTEIETDACISFAGEGWCQNCRSNAIQLHHTCDSLGGSSGGGLFDASTHRLFALNWGGVQRANDTGGYNYGTALADLVLSRSDFAALLTPLAESEPTPEPETGGTPSTWTCSPDFYGTGDGCDCGCGAVDPDCASSARSACQYCNDPGSCSNVSCDGILTANNGVCDAPAEEEPVCVPSCPACSTSPASDGCGGTCQPTCETSCSGDVCEEPPPADAGTWTCNPAYYGTGDGCDCGCGKVDPDCASDSVTACQYCGGNGACGDSSCAGLVPANNAVCNGAGAGGGVPSSWTCNPDYYGAGDGCDCGCGAVDPDCSSAQRSACQYCGGCANSTCSNVMTSNNAECSN